MAMEQQEFLAGLGAWAAELNTTIDVLRRVLYQHGAQPIRRGRNSLYRARDVCTAWATHIAAHAGPINPDSLAPMDRRAYYQAENEKLRLEIERGRLVPADEVERAHGQIFGTLVHGLETLPDVLERDCGLTSDQVQRVESHIDALRESLYRALIDDSAEEARDVAAAA